MSFRLVQELFRKFCRVIFNSMVTKILPMILADFDAKKYFPGCKRKKLISILVKETTYLSLPLLKVINEFINVDFLKQIFETYKKSDDYSAKSLDIEI